MTLPTEGEINPIPADLDGQAAVHHFLGKNLEEAEALFRQNSLCYQEDLLFMGIVAFRFYIHAAINYIMSDASKGDSDIINCLLAILEHRLKHEAVELRPVAPSLANICSYIIHNYEKFDVTEEVYGDLRSRYNALEQIFSAK